MTPADDTYTELPINNSPEGLRILVVRADRLGDVILATPVFEAVKQHYPKSHVTAVIQGFVAPLIQGSPAVDEVLVFDPGFKHSGLRGFWALVSELRRSKSSVAIILNAPFRLAFAVFLSGIRYRIGPYSKFYSYIFYNRGMRQRRSHVEMHETDYNLQLLRQIGIRVGTRSIPTAVNLPQVASDEVRVWLQKQGWDSTQPLIVVHPGMGGSALNWPEKHYVELIRALIREGRKVVVTGGPGEGLLLDRIQTELDVEGEKVWFFGKSGTENLEKLAGLYSLATVIVAPSTGPLHLAVALGKRVVTFFPPIRVQSAVRWGPYLREESRAKIMVPEVYCGQDFECRGTLCNYFPCMKSLLVTHALEHVNHHLAKEEITSG